MLLHWNWKSLLPLSGRGSQSLSEQRSALGEQGHCCVTAWTHRGVGSLCTCQQEGGNGIMSPGGLWDLQSSEIWTHLILTGNKSKGNLLPWVKKYSFI